MNPLQAYRSRETFSDKYRKGNPGGIIQEETMAQRRAALAALMCSLLALWVFPACAQFPANIQVVIQDPSGAGLANAQIILVNPVPVVQQTPTSDPSGNFRFVS